MLDSDFRLPWMLRALNVLGAGLGGRWPALDPETLWAEALRATDGRGEVIEAREALAVLLDQANAADLSTLGRLALRSELSSPRGTI
jgi:hypothetical protein